MRNERGFMLLEVLIAFAIAALAVTVLFRAAHDGLRAAAVAGRYEEALVRARSHLAALGIAVAAMDTQGEDGGGFHWHARVAPIGSAVTGPDAIGDVPAIRATLYSVSVVVSWREGGRTRAVELDSERLGATLATGAGGGR
jgi:general secretion pathway protein I